MNQTLERPSRIYRRTVRSHVAGRQGGLFVYEPVNEKAAAFHLSEARTRCLFGGNRSGKTETVVADVASEMQGTHPLQLAGKRPMPPLKWRVVGVDQPHGVDKILIPKFQKFVRPSSLHGGSWEKAYSVREHTLHYKDGGFVEFMSYESDVAKFAGTDRDGILCDEEPPKSIWDECRMRLLERKGRMLLSMTADNGCTWVYDQFYLPWETGTLKSDVACWRMTLYENPHIPPEEIADAEAGLDEQTKRIKIYGEFVHRSGLIFEDFKNQEPWVYNDFDIPHDWTRYVCIDPHPRQNHAILIAAVSPSGEIWAYKEIVHSTDIDVNCDHLKRELNGIVPYDILIDWAARGDDYRHGVSIFDYYDNALLERSLPGLSLAMKDVEAGLVALRAGFQWDSQRKCDRPIPYRTNLPDTGGPQIHVARKGCPTLIWQLMRYVYDDYTTRKMADRRDPKSSPRKKDDHVIDDLRYILVEEPHYIGAPEAPDENRWMRRREQANPFDGPEEDLDQDFMPEYPVNWMEA